MARSRTTRCCSAFALIVGLTGVVAAQIPTERERDQGPPPIFPTAPIWTIALEHQLTVPPAFDATHAYFALDDGRIAAYGLPDGNRLWIESGRPLLEPTAGGDRLFVVDADGITARNAADGTIAWRKPFADKLAAPLVWTEGWLVAATASGSVIAYHPKDGEQIWTRELGTAAHARPALTADRAYIPTENGRVVALRLETGDEMWQRRLGGTANDILALGDRLYVGSNDNFLYCLMVEDGRIDWRWRTGGDVIGRPVADEKNVYFVSLDNALRALARKSGTQMWIRPLPLRPTSGPMLASGTVIAGGVGAKQLRGYRLRDGADAGELATGSELGGAVYLVDRTDSPIPWLLFVTRDVAKGAAVTMVKRTFEPVIQQVGPLPNPVVVPPTLPTSPRESALPPSSAATVPVR